MVDSGLSEYYTQMAEFKHQLRLMSLNQDEDNELQALTIDHMKRVMLFFHFFNLIAEIVFVLETLVFEAIRWHDRKHFSFLNISIMLFRFRRSVH